MGGAVATFVYADWVARYPEFAAVPEPTASAYFTEATVYLRNDGTGPVNSTVTQTVMLYALTAHVAQLNWTPAGESPSQIVGQVTNASEGSVSVQAKFADQVPGTMGWFLQTKYGTSYWQMAAPFRTMHYRGPPTRPWMASRFGYLR